MIMMHVLATSIAMALACGSEIGRPAALSPSDAAAFAAAQAALGQDFDMRTGGTVEISGEPLAVTFERVVEDSRCPTNVTCVREGDAVVRVRLQGAGKEEATLTLHTHPSGPQESSFQKYRARLVRLLPVPRDTARVPSEAYVATLNISRDK
jgi:hypothetical protein